MSIANCGPKDRQVSFHAAPAGAHTLIMLLGCAILSVAACGSDPAGTTAPSVPPPPPASGSILVQVLTSGELTGSSYLISVDQGTGVSVAINGSITIPNLDVSQHQVMLQGLPGNCLVAGDNPQTVSVTAGEVTSVQFAVTCAATTGTIQASLETTGRGSDPDGLTVVLDDTVSVTTHANGIVRFTEVVPGSHTVGIQDAASNCTPPAQQDVDVIAGDTATVMFAIRCVEPPPLSNQIFFFSNPGSGTHPWIMNADGSGARQLPGPIGFRPDISSDGRLITYDAQGRIVLVQPDGNLLGNLGNGFGPSWSPDDSQITFHNAVAGQEEVFVMNANGTLRRNITNSDSTFDIFPDWGGDGRIAFARQPSGGGALSIFLLESDGTGLQEIRPGDLEEEGQVKWSPDGQWLLYTRQGTDIWVVRPDGTGLRNLTDSPSTTDIEGSWSPDGTKIAFSSLRNGNWDIYSINFDGSGLTRLTTDPAHDAMPTWSP